MGLGLSISRRIIEDHGGDLRLVETSTKGCVFEIVLPGGATSIAAPTKGYAALSGPISEFTENGLVR